MYIRTELSSIFEAISNPHPSLMAGHFILKSITVSDLSTARSKPGITLSDLVHVAGTRQGNDAPFQGWTKETRDELTRALGNQEIADRKKLPPHRYLVISSASHNAETSTYLTGAGWVESMIRPTGAGLGLSALSRDAQSLWAAGNKVGALLTQCCQGNVSIEIYYIAGESMV